MTRSARILVALLITVIALALGAAFVFAAKVGNGDFENGNLSGWTEDSQGSGHWVAYTADTAPQGVLPPPQGEFAAGTEPAGPSSKLLLHTIHLRANSSHKLSLMLSYDNAAGEFFTPNSLDQGPTMRRRGTPRGGTPNQQLRIDIIRDDSPPRTMKKSDILLNVFRTRVGDPVSTGWKRIRANLSDLAGRTVLLRVAEVDNQFVFTAGLDDVKIRSRHR